mgnify:CR=1 FL=1
MPKTQYILKYPEDREEIIHFVKQLLGNVLLCDQFIYV